jgi:hypothetical protein
MELRDAIDRISAIHSQLAATGQLRSLRALPVAFSGLLAIAAALLQPFLVGDPLQSPAAYALHWCSAAIASATVAAVATAQGVWRHRDALGPANARHALVQFLPCLLVGAFVTWFVVVRLPQQLWLLPGLWQLLFGLGNLAAHRLLPAPAVLVGVAFLATGACCLWFGERALDPWAMGLPFAGGQLALAAILWWHHERPGNRGDWR